MKVIIEKELCEPKNGELVGPFYHIYGVSEDGKKNLIETVEGNIEEAARVAEQKLDWNELEVSYQQYGPKIFSSIVSPKKFE